MRTAEVDSSLLIAVKSNWEFIDLKQTTSHSVEILFYSFEKCDSLPREAPERKLASQPVGAWIPINIMNYVDSNDDKLWCGYRIRDANWSRSLRECARLVWEG